MAQSLNRRAHSLLLMDPFAMWEHPDSLLRKAGVTNTQSGDLSAERRVPAVEVAESGGNLIISAELPGLSAEDVEVETIGNLLIIQGEHRRSEDQKPEGTGQSAGRDTSIVNSSCQTERICITPGPKLTMACCG